MDKHQTLEENCEDGKCGRAYHGDIDSFHKWRDISTAGYAVGIAGLGAGAVLLWWGDADEESRTALQLRPDGAALTHVF